MWKKLLLLNAIDGLIADLWLIFFVVVGLIALVVVGIIFVAHVAVENTHIHPSSTSVIRTLNA